MLGGFGVKNALANSVMAGKFGSLHPFTFEWNNLEASEESEESEGKKIKIIINKLNLFLI